MPPTGECARLGLMAATDISVAPFEGCVCCYRGDTATGVVVVGEAKFITASLHRLTGLQLEEAVRLFELATGCDRGKVPDGRLAVGFRLCRQCAKWTSANIVELAAFANGDEVFAYVQPDGDDWPGLKVG